MKKGHKKLSLRGVDLAFTALNHIIAHPSEYNQGSGHCGSGGCYLGWVLAFAVPDEIDKKCWNKGEHKHMDMISRAADVLGITDYAAEELFNGSNTFGMIYNTVVDLFKGVESSVRLKRLPAKLVKYSGGYPL